MINYLPKIYPDELFYSWLCRYYIHSGCLSNKMALLDFMCKKSDNPSKEFVGNLNTKAISIIGQMYSIDNLILEHTMFPQYARFIPLEKQKASIKQLAYETCDAHHLFQIPPRNKNEKHLKYCPLCAKEDREQYGEAYWHRVHQIRDMRICTKHQCYLEESKVSSKSENTFSLFPAEVEIPYDINFCITSNTDIIQYSQYIEDVFLSKLELKEHTPIHIILYNGLQKTQYVAGKTKNTQNLVNDINQFYQSIGISSIATLSQVQRTFIGDIMNFSVVCQIAYFLKIPIKDLLNPNLTKQQIKCEDRSHYIKNRKPIISWDVYDNQKAELLEKIAYNLYYGTENNGKPEKVTEKIICKKLQLLSHQLENMPKCKAILERYNESYPEFWARRIVWGYVYLSETKEQFYWSDIRNITSVKKENFSKVEPYLSKYVDDETVQKIIQITYMK